MPDLEASASTTATDVTATPAAADTTQVTATPAPSTEEPKELEVVHEGAPINGSQIIEDDTTDIKPADAESAREGDDKANNDTEVETKPQEDKKRDANARIRELNDQKNAAVKEAQLLRRQIADAVKAKHPSVDIEKMVAEGVDENTARMDKFEADSLTKDLTTQLVELNTSINQETIDVARDFPYMDSDRTDRSPEDVKKAETITNLWFEAAHVEFAEDENGNKYLTQADSSLYDFVKKIDDFASISAQASEVQGQRNAEKHLSAVEIPTGPAPRQNRADDAKLSAADYAAKHGLKVVGG